MYHELLRRNISTRNKQSSLKLVNAHKEQATVNKTLTAFFPSADIYHSTYLFVVQKGFLKLTAEQRTLPLQSDICDQLLPVKLSSDIFIKAKKLLQVEKPLKRAAMECSFLYFLRTYCIHMLNCVLCSSLNTFPPVSVLPKNLVK